MPYSYNPFTGEFDKVSDVSGFADTFETDVGTANPASGIIIIAGGTAINTSGAGNTVTIDFDITGAPDIATSFVTDAGTANPALNSLSILGGNGISTSAVSDTITVTLDTPVTVIDGGSERASATEYAVITGGVTSTDPHQSIASVGSIMEILTSNGAGALPTFQIGDSNAWTEVDATTASNDPDIIFTDLTTFDIYRFQIESILPINNNVFFLLTISIDNGSSYLAADYWSSHGNIEFFDRANWILNANGQGNAAARFMLGDLVFLRNIEGSEYPSFSGFTYYIQSSAFERGGSSYGVNLGAGTSDIDAVKFAYGAGNIASGTIRLFGR